MTSIEPKKLALLRIAQIFAARHDLREHTDQQQDAYDDREDEQQRFFIQMQTDVFLGLFGGTDFGQADPSVRF